MPSTVLLTGGTGFVGSQAAFELSKRGHRVVVLDIRPPSGYANLLLKSAGSNLTFVEGDLSDFSILVSTIRDFAVDKIVHLAHLYSPSPALEIRRNIEAGLNVIESAKLMKVSKIVNISSQGVYGPAPDGVDVTEDKYVAPLTAYGCYKLAVEHIGSIYERAYGVTCISLRLSGVYGSPADNEVKFYKIAVEKAVRRLPVKFDSGGDQMRDFIHVKDVASAIQLALDVDESRLEHRTFNIAWGQPYPQREFVRIINDVCHEILVAMGPGTGPQIDTIAQDYGAIICQNKSIERAKKELGWTPIYDLRSGIEDYVKSCKMFLEREALPRSAT